MQWFDDGRRSIGRIRHGQARSVQSPELELGRREQRAVGPNLGFHVGTPQGRHLDRRGLNIPADVHPEGSPRAQEAMVTAT